MQNSIFLLLFPTDQINRLTKGGKYLCHAWQFDLILLFFYINLFEIILIKVVALVIYHFEVIFYYLNVLCSTAITKLDGIMFDQWINYLFQIRKKNLKAIF